MKGKKKKKVNEKPHFSRLEVDCTMSPFNESFLSFGFFFGAVLQSEVRSES